MRYDRPKRPIRGGITLVELLVVISIMVILMGVAIPAMRPALDGRRVREAARAINVYLGTARSRAIETGRPCGVILRRFDGQPECAMVLEQAEVPPPYGGDMLDAVARLQLAAPDGILSVPHVHAVLTGCLNPGLVRTGDLVQFNHQGPYYRIVGPDVDADTILDDTVATGDHLELAVDYTQGNLLPWPDGTATPTLWSAPMPYEIIRQPVKSVAAPLQLPASTVVDLQWSGSDSLLRLGWPGSLDTHPVFVMFSPTGALDRIVYTHVDTTVVPHTLTPMNVRVTEPICLLVGKREQVSQPLGDPAGGDDEALANWQILSNLWVTLNPQTGLVISSQNAGYTSGTDLTDPVNLAVALREARQYAREGQSLGGR